MGRPLAKPNKIQITDYENRLMKLESNGSLPVSIQDQSSEIIDLYFCRILGTTTVASPITIDAKQVTVASNSGAAQYDCIEISEDGHVFQALVTAISGNNISFNAPTDIAFSTNAVVKFGEWNMNYDGSGATLIYTIMPPAGVKWDICRIIFGMLDDVAMDDGKFGGISPLTNGLVLRIKNGVTKNIFIVSDNGGLRERSFDVQYIDKAPAGQYGFGCRRTFNGQEKNGVVIRLDGDTNDQLQILIQDNLTAITKLACVAQGHLVV